MQKLYIFIFSLFIIAYQYTKAANELYINGQPATISAAATTLYNNGALIRVNGDVTVQDGLFVNSGTNGVEITGNWLNNQPSGNNKYQSTGTERFLGTTDQTIDGKMDGISGNDNQFYNLYINKTSTTGEYVSLLTNVHVNAAGTLNFGNTNGIIRTQATSIGSSDATSTGNYTNYIYVQNPSTSAINGNSIGSGATTRYIEGKLKRQVNSAATYYFPIGVNKNYLGGMNAYQLKFNSIPASTGILSYIEIGTQNLLNFNVFADVAQVDNNPLTPNPFSSCIGPPDGIIDWMKLTEKITHQWWATPDNITAYNYDITVFPSTQLENTANYPIVPCSPNYKLQYLARDGVPGGNLATLQPAAGFGNTIGYFMLPTGKTLPAQTSFSNFRLWGTIDANTVLPVELVYLTASPIDNKFIRLNWKTASEFNNKGFQIERSTDGTQFTAIGWVNGQGNSNIPVTYIFNDNDVQADIAYYYRLKQIDYNQHSTFSNIVYAKLTPTNDFFVGDLYPNPTYNNTQIDIISPKNDVLFVNIYDVLGKTLQVNQEILKKGVNTLKINTENLPAANYLLQFKTNENIYSKKLIKQ